MTDSCRRSALRKQLAEVSDTNRGWQLAMFIFAGATGRSPLQIPRDFGYALLTGILIDVSRATTRVAPTKPGDGVRHLHSLRVFLASISRMNSCESGFVLSVFSDSSFTQALSSPTNAVSISPARLAIGDPCPKTIFSNE